MQGNRSPKTTRTGESISSARRSTSQHASAISASPGEILISDVVRQLVAGKEFLFSDRGDTALRGFEDPVRLYEVRWQAEVSP